MKIKEIKNWIKKNTEKIFIILIGIMLIILIINLISLSITGNILKIKVNEIKEFNKPSEIQLSVIECNGCSDISEIVDSIKKQNVNITEEKRLSIYDSETKNLISRYGIEKLPNVLIFGEIDNNKTDFKDFEKVDNALVFSKVEPPFLEIATNELKGQVNIIEIVDSSCEKCVSLSSISLSLAEAGVFISDWKKIEYNSVEGQQLINKFGVKHVPALLISEDIDYYESLSQSLSQLDLENKQGFYAIHSTLPPYRNLTNNKIIGFVDLIMLEDKSCDSCYDVTLNKQILKGLGVAINNEKIYDISSSDGKALISKYNIEKVPIIILSPEANVYGMFVQAWQQVGTKEKDGWFIMRTPENLGTVKNLKTREIIG